MTLPFVSGVLLAAGHSTRFEGSEPKQLALFRGEPLVRRAARTALNPVTGLGELIVVVGHQHRAVAAAVEDLDLRVVLNRDFADGQSTSLHAGLAAVDSRAEGALFLPCDQPLLTPTLLHRLLTTFAESPPDHRAIVAPAHRGLRRAPTFFPRRLFPELATLDGDRGGRALLGRYREDLRLVEVEREEPLLDVDTVADLRRLEGVEG